MTVGEKIKSTLKLTQFPNVYITKGLRSGSKSIYYIFFNSAYPQVKINHTKLKRMQNVDILRGEHLERGEVRPIEYFPFQKLEDFNSSVKNAYIVLYDIAGMNKFLRYDYFSESTHYSSSDFYTDLVKGFSDVQLKVYQNRLNELTIPQLRNVDYYTSDKTKYYKDIRKKYQGQGIKNTKLVDTALIPETGSIRFTFITEATDLSDKEIDKENLKHKMGKDKKQEYDIALDKLVDNPSHTYDMYLQLENVFPNNYYSDISWLEVYSGEVVNQKMMKELLEVADVKIWDTTPANQYQGFRYRLSLLGASIFPESRPDSFWRQFHGSNGLLDKHFSQLFDKGTITTLANNLTSSFFNLLKKEGYIDEKTKTVK